MRKFLLLLLFYSAPSVACDFSEGISKLNDHYVYTQDCHREVGRMVKEIEMRKQQKLDYERLIEVKEIQVQSSKEYIKALEQSRDLWKDTALDVQERAKTIESLSDSNKWLYIGAGVLLTVAAGWAIGAAAGANAAMVVLL